MTLAAMVGETPWAAVRTALREAYPDADLVTYGRVFSHVQGLTPEVSTMRIILEQFPGDERRILVSGVDSSPAPDLEGTRAESRYALMFEPWERWLGMPIDPRSAASFAAAETVAHCLWTMTFDGSEELQLEGRVQWQRRFESPESASPSETTVGDLELLKALGEQLRSVRSDPED